MVIQKEPFYPAQFTKIPFFHCMAKQSSTKEKEKSPKPTVISFRISETQELALTEINKRDQAVGVNSTRQLCRKVVIDYLAGRLVYKNPKDKAFDLEKYPQR